jgi:hypothetical protein
LFLSRLQNLKKSFFAKLWCQSQRLVIEISNMFLLLKVSTSLPLKKSVCAGLGKQIDSDSVTGLLAHRQKNGTSYYVLKDVLLPWSVWSSPLRCVKYCNQLWEGFCQCQGVKNEPALIKLKSPPDMKSRVCLFGLFTGQALTIWMKHSLFKSASGRKREWTILTRKIF